MRRSDDTFLVVAGTIVGIIAVGLLLAGGAVLVVGYFAGTDGSFEGPAIGVSSDGYAVRTDQLSLGANPGAWFPDGGAVRTRITAAPDTPDRPVFIGIASSEDIDRWLGEAAHSDVVAVGDDGETEVEVVSGDATPAPAADQGFWEVSAMSSGETSLIWDHRFGDWELVVANEDGSAEVVATARGEVRLRLASQVGWTMVASSGVIGLVAAILLSTAFRHRRRRDTPDDDVDGRPSRLPVTPGSGGDSTRA